MKNIQLFFENNEIVFKFNFLYISSLFYPASQKTIMTAQSYTDLKIAIAHTPMHA